MWWAHQQPNSARKTLTRKAHRSSRPGSDSRSDSLFVVVLSPGALGCPGDAHHAAIGFRLDQFRSFWAFGGNFGGNFRRHAARASLAQQRRARQYSTRSTRLRPRQAGASCGTRAPSAPAQRLALRRRSSDGGALSARSASVPVPRHQALRSGRHRHAIEQHARGPCITVERLRTRTHLVNYKCFTTCTVRPAHGVTTCTVGRLS